MLTNIITIVLLAIYVADLVRTLPRIGRPRSGLAGRVVGDPKTHVVFASLFVFAGVVMAMGEISAPRYAGWVLIVGGVVHAVTAIRAISRKPKLKGPARIS